MPARTITRRLDLRGVVCPGPTVETRLTLKEMSAGEVLEVITDYYPARQTIPALMSDLGYPFREPHRRIERRQFLIGFTYSCSWVPSAP